MKLDTNLICDATRCIHNNANYCYATGLGLSKYILVGHGEQKEGGNFKKAIVADIFESLKSHYGS